MPARKCHCDHFAAICAPRSPTANPSMKKIILEEMNDPTHMFFQKSTSYCSPAHPTMIKMAANGFSSYELFIKIITFYCVLQYFLPLFMKTHFFIPPHINIVYRGLCVPTLAASCSPYFMKTDRQKHNFKLTLSPQIQDQKNPGPLQTEAQRLTM